MRRPRCRFLDGAALAFVVAALVTLAPRDARAQACCAGTSAVTPARLALHEDALVGLQARAADAFASFDAHARYVPSPKGASELDFEQDLFGALRVWKRAQVALLIPFIETHRAASGIRELGGGIGDLNVSARYDFTTAGTSRFIPGIAALAGVTFPTGVAPESATTPLQTGATGIGAFQGNVGLAFEQSFGPFMVNLTGLAAKRLARTVHEPTLDVHEELATQWTALLTGAYSLPNDAAVALALSYTGEGDATINGATAPESARELVAVSVAGLYPIDDHWKLASSAFFNPWVNGFGRNQLASTGVTATVVRAW